MTEPIQRAKAFLELPEEHRTEDLLVDMFVDAGSDGRVHGERWSEIAIASWLESTALDVSPEVRAVLVDRAEQIRKRSWRRPEFRSGIDLAELVDEHFSKGKTT